MMKPPSIHDCYRFRVHSIDRILDGDTVDVTIDMGFGIMKVARCRLSGINSPETRTRNQEEKALGLRAKKWLEEELNGQQISINSPLKHGIDKYGRVLGWVYTEGMFTSINERMVSEKLVWEYDGGEKNKDFSLLKEIA